MRELIFVLSFLITSPAAVGVQVHRRFYSVQGLTTRQLVDQFHSKGPHGQAAYTRWDIHWHYGFNKIGSHCELNALNVQLDITYTMPRWADYARAGRSGQNEWDRYYHALENHEDGHAANGRAAYGEIQRALADISSAPRCEELGRRLDRAARSIIDEYAHKDVSYDDRTRHGASQGAQLRLPAGSQGP